MAVPSFQFDSPGAALGALLPLIVPVGSERIPLEQSPGRILAQRITADRPSPACDVSAMDGYAVRTSELGAGSLLVAGEVAIGKAPQPLPTGAALRIVTGAPIPEGADAVLKREDTDESPERIAFDISKVGATPPGTHIRRAGENLAQGAVVCEPARMITPALAGSLATFGVVEPEVFRKVRVGVVVTGDEVVDPGETPERWKLRDSHLAMLGAMIGARGFLEAGPLVRVRDDAGAIHDAARSALDACDALICTGGVSMGDHDHVPGVIERLGAQVVFHKLPQRPGKPALGAVADGKPVFGLPGNPLSVLVTARRLAIPALLRRSGADQVNHAPRVMIENPDGAMLHLWWHRLVRLTIDGDAELLPTVGSGDIGSAATSDGFVEVPPGESGAGPWLFYRW